MNQFIEINLTTIPVTLVIGALFTWLGKVLATRIAAKELHELNVQLELLKTEHNKEVQKIKLKLDFQNTLIAQVQQNASLERLEISKEQVKAIKELWIFWLAFKAEIAKFQTPHQLLKSSELNNPALFKKIFSYSTEELSQSISRCMKHAEKIDELRPLIPIQIYQHYLGLSTLYIRMAIRLMIDVPRGNKILEWYLDDSGNYDFSISKLMNYANSQSIVLPDPKTGGDSFETFAKWKWSLEEKFNELIYQFINGSLSRQIEIHASIRDLAEKQSISTTNN